MRDELTQIALILDRSGSMGSIAGATVEGVNAFVAEQQKAPGEALLYFVQFDDVYERVYDGSIQNAPLLTLAKTLNVREHRFQPRGWTALLDAIGTTLDDVGKRLGEMPEAERPGKVVVVIMTDGMENKSKKFTRDRIAEMIALQRDVYKWQFQFLGANQDAIQEAAKYNIPAANAVSFASTATGTGNVIRAMSINLTNYRVSGQARAMSYSPEDRAKAMAEDRPAPGKH
jgi:hypothetical protein